MYVHNCGDLSEMRGISKNYRVVYLKRCPQSQDSDLRGDAQSCIMPYRWGLWLTFRMSKVPVGNCWPLYQEVASTAVNHYSRTMVEKDVGKIYPDMVLHLLSAFFVLLFPFCLPTLISPELSLFCSS
jgi:hypothetical protein